jgi:hypothetical protein
MSDGGYNAVAFVSSDSPGPVSRGRGPILRSGSCPGGAGKQFPHYDFPGIIPGVEGILRLYGKPE